ncbi:hypothetical protein B0H13DRAFT_1909399 [Mycena leptocephala]|nr:hypothetical protein B0H13DRAFT_1909399 [Mycena leptocephala]
MYVGSRQTYKRARAGAEFFSHWRGRDQDDEEGEDDGRCNLCTGPRRNKALTYCVHAVGIADHNTLSDWTTSLGEVAEAEARAESLRQRLPRSTTETTAIMKWTRKSQIDRCSDLRGVKLWMYQCKNLDLPKGDGIFAGYRCTSRIRSVTAPPANKAKARRPPGPIKRLSTTSNTSSSSSGTSQRLGRTAGEAFSAQSHLRECNPSNSLFKAIFGHAKQHIEDIELSLGYHHRSWTADERLATAIERIETLVESETWSCSEPKSPLAHQVAGDIGPCTRQDVLQDEWRTLCSN